MAQIIQEGLKNCCVGKSKPMYTLRKSVVKRDRVRGCELMQNVALFVHRGYTLGTTSESGSMI
jgi:hypothetical protein